MSGKSIKTLANQSFLWRFRILPTPRWTTPLALVAVAMPVALAGQDALSTGGNAAATQTSPSTLVARLATVWRAYADGRIEQFPHSFPESGTEFAHYGSTYPLPSSDQRHIAFVRDNDLWLLDIGTGSVTQTTHIGRPYTASQASVFVLVTAWSSDSRRLLYYVMAGETEDPEGRSPELEVRVAEYGFHIYDTESGESQPIDIPGEYLAWLPSGDFLLTLTDTIPVARQLSRLGAEGGDPALVTPQRGWFTQADGSPDGNLLLVGIGRRVAGRLTSQIVEVDVTTGALREVTSVGGWAEFQWARFSPSGTRIAYQHRLSQPIRSTVVVDRKAVYHCKTASTRCLPQWIDDRSLVILDLGPDEKALVVVNADSGEVKVRYRFDPPQ